MVFGGHDHLQRVAAPEVCLAHSRRVNETIGQGLEQLLLLAAGTEQERREHVRVEVKHDEHADDLKPTRGAFGEELRGAGDGVGVCETEVGESLADVGRFATPKVGERPVLEL